MTGEDAESAIGKAGRHLIPFLVLCYAVNFLDLPGRSSSAS